MSKYSFYQTENYLTTFNYWNSKQRQRQFLGDDIWKYLQTRKCFLWDFL
jgi:hypothetical protein